MPLPISMQGVGIRKLNEIEASKDAWHGFDTRKKIRAITKVARESLSPLENHCHSCSADYGDSDGRATTRE